MRNADNRAAEGPQPDGNDGVYSSVVARRSRRKPLMIGAAGLVAILGAGAVVGQQMRAGDTAAATETGLAAPFASDPPVAVAEPGNSAPSSAGTSAPVPAAPTSPLARPTRASETPEPRTTEEKIRAARAAAARDGVPVHRPLPAPTGTAAEVAADANVTEVQVPTKNGTLKVVSAPADLTGLRELAWVVDKGVPVGKARCTNKVRLSPGTPALTRPTLLLCWSTSAAKSAYTVAADPGGTPSKSESVAAIEKALAKLS